MANRATVPARMNDSPIVPETSHVTPELWQHEWSRKCNIRAVGFRPEKIGPHAVRACGGPATQTPRFEYRAWPKPSPLMRQRRPAYIRHADFLFLNRFAPVMHQAIQLRQRNSWRNRRWPARQDFADIRMIQSRKRNNRPPALQILQKRLCRRIRRITDRQPEMSLLRLEHRFRSMPEKRVDAHGLIEDKEHPQVVPALE